MSNPTPTCCAGIDPAPQGASTALVLTGAQVFRLADIIGNDPGSEDDQISIQFLAAGLDGPGLYAWMTEYPDEGACPLFDTSVGAEVPAGVAA